MRVLFLAAAIALSSPLQANTPTSETNNPSAGKITDAPAAEQPKEEPKICRRIESTETRLGSKKLCLTAREWKKRGDSD